MFKKKSPKFVVATHQELGDFVPLPLNKSTKEYFKSYENEPEAFLKDGEDTPQSFKDTLYASVINCAENFVNMVQNDDVPIVFNKNRDQIIQELLDGLINDRYVRKALGDAVKSHLTAILEYEYGVEVRDYLNISYAPDEPQCKNENER